LKEYIKSSPIKGVISTSQATTNGESWTDDHLHSMHRCYPFDYVYCVATVTNSALLWKKLDTVPRAK